VVPGWVAGVVEGTGVEGVTGGKGVVAGVVSGTGVVVVRVVIPAVGVGGFVGEMAVPPTEKLRILESGACRSKEAGSCHFAWTV
jgi:hypothetical protein